MDVTLLHLGRRAHLLHGRAELERVVDVGGAAVLRIAGVKLQDVLRANRQMEAAETTVTPETKTKAE